MGIPDGYLYEYAVVRYVPRVDREEFVNIGLIMMCKRRKWLRGEIRLNPSRISVFDPRADIAMIASQASVFKRSDVPSADIPVEERYRWLTAVKSAVLQVSASHPGLLGAGKAADAEGEDVIRKLDEEFDRLFKELIL